MKLTILFVIVIWLRPISSMPSISSRMSYVRRNTYSRPPAGGREQRIASNYHDVSSVVPVNYHKKRQLQDFSFDEFYSVLGEPVYGDEPEPIRIKVLTDLLLENVENRTVVDQGKIRTLIDTVIPNATATWAKYISTRPVQGNLPFTMDACGGEFPSAAPNFANTFQDYLENGIPDADIALVALVDCEAQAIAAAVSCNRDQYDRPVIGAVSFCLSEFFTMTEDDIFDARLVVIHELSHALGHSTNLFPYFRNETTGEPLTPRGENGTIPKQTVTCNDGSVRTIEFPANNTIQMRVTTPGITGEERIHYEVVTPRVQTVVRNLYNCSSLMGARLESEPTNTVECAGTHWHERQFFTELLSAYFNHNGDVGQADVLSPLTLALLEDSGWYKVSYEGIGNFPYGLARGCEFATQDCIVNDTVPDYGKGTFCATVNSDTGDMEQEAVFCDPSHTTFSFCDLYRIDNFPFLAQVPENPIRYFTNESILPASSGWDNCPLPMITAYPGDCTVEERFEDNRLFQDEVYGPSSRCVNTVREGQLPRPACLSMECDADNFQAVINGIACEFDGQMHDIELINGTGTAQFECPRLSILCPNLFCQGACSGRGTCDYNVTPPKCECFDSSDTSPLCNQGELEHLNLTSGTMEQSVFLREGEFGSVGIVVLLVCYLLHSS